MTLNLINNGLVVSILVSVIVCLGSIYCFGICNRQSILGEGVFSNSSISTINKDSFFLISFLCEIGYLSLIL